MHKVCQVLHKCHNYHAILHKLYTWFGKNQLRLYLNAINGAKNFFDWGAAFSKYAHDHSMNIHSFMIIVAMITGGGGYRIRPMQYDPTRTASTVSLTCFVNYCHCIVMYCITSMVGIK